MRFTFETIKELPCPEIIESLCHKYAHDSNSKAFSSFWRVFANQSQVELKNSGEFSKIAGVGFGDYRVRGVVDRLMGMLNFASHAPCLKTPLSLFLKQYVFLAQLKVPLLNFNSFRQAAVASIVVDHFRKAGVTPETVCIIGDGYGILGALLKKNYPRLSLTLVDLGKVQIFSCAFLQYRLRKVAFRLASPDEVFDPKGYDGIQFIPAELVRDLRVQEGRFDLVINVGSMQEMSYDWIEFYFTWMRKMLCEGGIFYCCNREQKILPGGESIEFERYPWQSADQILMDERPSFSKWFFSRHPTKNGVTLFGTIRIPFMRRLDGTVRHRLVKMSKLRALTGQKAHAAATEKDLTI